MHVIQPLEAKAICDNTSLNKAQVNPSQYISTLTNAKKSGGLFLDTSKYSLKRLILHPTVY